MISGDLSHARRRRIGPPQRCTSLVQPLKQDISRRTFAQEFGAAHSQRSLGDADLCRQSGHGESFIGPLAQHLLKASHYSGVMLPRLGIVVRLVAGQTVNDGVKHFLLQRSRDLGTIDQFLSSFREATRLTKQTLKSQCSRARRPDYSACRWR